VPNQEQWDIKEVQTQMKTEKRGVCGGYHQWLFYKPFRTDFGIIGIGFSLALPEDFGSIHLGDESHSGFT